MARPNASTSSSSRRSIYNTNRKADLRPIPGNLENSLTAFSNNAEGYLSVIDSEINAYSYLQTYRGILAVVLETLVVINSRFDGNRAADEESIAHFNSRHEVIIVLNVHEFSICTKENTILFNIISCTDTSHKTIWCKGIRVHLKVYQPQQHQVIGEEVAQLSLHTEVQIVGSSIAHVQAGQ